MITGEVYAIACSFLWAVSSAMTKSQATKMSVVTLGAVRTVPGLLVYWALVLLSGKAREFARFSVRNWVFLGVSTLAGLIVGDLMYHKSLKQIGLARAMPLSMTYPFFTLTLAALFLREPFTWTILVGGALIAVGAYLLAAPRRSVPTRVVPEAPGQWSGTALAIGAALCWGTSTVLLRVGIDGIDVVVANAIRLSLLAVTLLTISLSAGDLLRVRRHGTRTLGIVVLAGLTGTSLGTYTFLKAVQLAGAAKTSVLTATTPLFGVPISLLLGEKPTPRTLAGTALTMVGIWLTVR
jgi:DME family drug/metabolite transporter